ncbi:MFS transporter, partial [Streptomyces sp. NPDC006265]|uniref:MFS transporter n=1 Tax=Streptomyces sp. NPDC006265 TaxID=3156740 RepID=UPI0033B6E8A6
MMFAVAMTFIDQTMVSIAPPDIVRELGLSSSGMQWVVNAYLLALAAFFALGGRLADLYGPRRVVVIGTVVFAVSSVLCGCVPEGGAAQAWLIIFRATQGLGAALLFPAAPAVVVAVFPVERRGRALALFFGVTGALTAIGPLLGGWLTNWTWRAVFWVNVPVAIVALAPTAMAHISDRRRSGTLDVPGRPDRGRHGSERARLPAGLVVRLGQLGDLGVHRGRPPDTRRVRPLRTAGGASADRPAVFRDKAFTVDAAVLFFSMLAFVPLFFFASVPMSAGPPLGVGGLPFEATELQLPEGSVVALYT